MNLGDIAGAFAVIGATLAMVMLFYYGGRSL